jgi:hypothetical protein
MEVKLLLQKFTLTYAHLIFIKLFVSLKALSLNSPSFVEYLKAEMKKYRLQRR